MPDDAPWVDPVVVPDDLQELQPDIEAYHRELRLAARRRRWQRLTGYRWWQRYAAPAGICAVAVAMAAVVLGVLTTGTPPGQPIPAPQPLATAPAAPVGELHGLIPDVAVRTDAGMHSIRVMRPALVALVPSPCQCETGLLARLAGQADEVGVPLVVVAPAEQDAAVARLTAQLHRGRVLPVYDPAATLATTYDARGVTVVALAPDGTVEYVQVDVPADVRLELFLQNMLGPTMGRAAS